MLRRHREYSGPVDCAWSSETPGRRGEVFEGIVFGRCPKEAATMEVARTAWEGRSPNASK
jgi:hypothetical protein